MMNYDFITILGPTACGKTALATALAARMPAAEIISADSRQVFRGMDIGTGKDLDEYRVGQKAIPYHLIDIAEAGQKYSVYEFQRDFLTAYQGVVGRGATPILCGGTGLYIESVLRSYRLVPVPENPELRQQLETKSMDELTEILSSYKKLHNSTDTDTPRRAIRAIEIEAYYKEHQIDQTEPFPALRSLTIGLHIDRDLRRQRISQRLRHRIEAEGMLDEVRGLLAHVPAETLISYGLEYRYLTLYLTGQLSYDEMLAQLEIAIFQFAKRQMTWFRGMERRGISIHWLDAVRPMEQNIDEILHLWHSA